MDFLHNGAQDTLTYHGYSVLSIDPPWPYSFQRTKKNGGFEYPPMPIQAIYDLPIQKLAAPDCALFLWATCPKLPEAIKTLEAWGFRFVTVPFVWVKLNKRGALLQIAKDVVLQGGVRSGTGHWVNSNIELVLLGVRGKPKRMNKSVKQVVFAPMTINSEKPAEVMSRIETLMGDVPRLEVFARKYRTGWSSTGLDLNGEYIQDVLKNIGEDNE